MSDSGVAEGGSQGGSSGIGSLKGWALVALQFALFGAVAASWFFDSPGPTLWHNVYVGAAFLLLGFLVGVWAVYDLGASLTPHPEPNHRGLVAGGIYKYVRHPIYTAVMFGALGVALANGKLTSWAAFVALFVLFEFKTRYEESYLVHAYVDYADYAAKTGKFLPHVHKRRKR